MDPAVPAKRPSRRLRVRVGGMVQGVGFRPFVHCTALELGLGGWVMNTPAGVLLEVEGDPDRLAAFLEAIRRRPPPRAAVSTVAVADREPLGQESFTIRASQLAGPRTAPIPTDLATCEACLAELFDPTDRRWRYPFTNCTQCGPRFSIIEAMPYDRARTTMRGFAMCAACQAEYADPSSRRFHAEPNACRACGPRLSLLDAEGEPLAAGDAALLQAVVRLRAGGIVAVKGIGGFHLLTDARNEAAILRLRARKRRPDKPLAVMFPTIEALSKACAVSDAERRLLTAPEAPIVLVRRADASIAAAAAPAAPWLGALLPYTPLHHLLLRELGFALVATSGNLSEEPISIDTAEALARLEGVADAFLTHDRPIVRPVEDSVVRVVGGRPLMLRRARGYAPGPIALPRAAPGLLAAGGHLKATVGLSTTGQVIVWPHIGDLESAAGRAAHGRATQDIARLCDIRPSVVARDLHPDDVAGDAGAWPAVAEVRVQHHLAHIAACLADNGAGPPALGVAWDGSGYGPDGTIWGGEFLHLAGTGWRRVARLHPFRLPGGSAAVREPRRAALGLLFAAFGAQALAMSELAPVADFTVAERRTLGAMLERGVNAPACSSIGRLFDAVAALTGLRQRSSYEGQAAAELEAVADGLADGLADAAGYDFPVRETGADPPLVVDWRPALARMLAEIRAGAPAGHVSLALHDGLAAAIVKVARRVGEPHVALSGGCFQNARLTEAAVAGLRDAGFAPLWHRWIPPNDGGLALGQAAWSAWTLEKGGSPCA